MKKIALALALTAAVAAQIFAAPARAAEIAPENINQGLGMMQSPQLGGPDTKALQLKPAFQIPQALLFVRRAELTSQLFVYTPGQYDPIGHLYVSPGYRHIWCYVKNYGLANSGPFYTRIRIYRYWPFPFVQTLQVNVPMNLPVGAYSLVGFRVSAPWGLKQVTSFADAGLVVPEYNEANNFDSVP